MNNSEKEVGACERPSIHMVFKGNLARGRTAEGDFSVKVKVNGKTEILSPLPSQALMNHSPDGFNWGYGGSGPAQLALALLFKVTGDRKVALRHYQDFKWDVVAKFKDKWQLSANDIKQWLNNR